MTDPTSLPLGYEYIKLGRTDSEIVFGIKNVLNESAAMAWLEKYSTCTKSVWRKLRTYPNSGRINIFRLDLRCTHFTDRRVTGARSSKHTNCPAQLQIIIRRYSDKSKSRALNMKFRKEYPAVVSIRYKHNHEMVDVAVSRSQQKLKKLEEPQLKIQETTFDSTCTDLVDADTMSRSQQKLKLEEPQLNLQETTFDSICTDLVDADTMSSTMEDVMTLNVATLSFRTSFLNPFIDELFSELQSLLNDDRFRLVTFRKGYMLQSGDELVLLKAWEKVDLVFYFSELSDFHLNMFSDDLKKQIQEKAPSLGELIFEIDNPQRYSCYFSGSTFVYQVPLTQANYKDFFEELPYVIFAAVEAKRLNIFCDLLIKVSDECPFFSKSTVQHINPAHRPRKSPYPMISVDEALKIVLSQTDVLGLESKGFRECLNFVLAEDVLATEPYPAFPASVKDGYAVNENDDAFNNNPSILKVMGDITPGFKPDSIVSPGYCMRVSTGSVVPEGANAVVQVEDTRISECYQGNEIAIEIVKKPKLNQDIRAIGSDVSEGEVLIHKNKKITPAEIGVMSICGIKNVLVYKKPWVAVMSSGDEVVEPDDPVLPGCIRDSNKSSLIHMLTENRISFIDVGIAKDDPDDVKSHLILAIGAADIVITTGGVSMGEKDILKMVLEKDFNAVIHFGRVHMKPGKPTTFSTAVFNGTKKLIFSLPGNPVSAYVCFYLFVIPSIKKMMGYDDPKHKYIKVKLGYDIKLDERPEFYRASLHCSSDGTFIALSTGGQQSSRLLSMQNAEALLVLPSASKNKNILKAGTLVDAILLKSM